MTRAGQECSWAEWTVLLALHALEPEQEAAVADHVRSCVTCQATMQEAEETFAAVGETAAVSPPPELRSRILAAVQEEAPPVRPMRVGSGRSGRVRPPEPGASRRGLRRWAVAAVAAVLVAGLAGGGIVVSQLDRQRDAATAHADTLDGLLAAIAASPHAVLVDRDRHPVAAVVLDNAPRFYDLDLQASPPGRVWVLWGARGQVMTALAAVPAGSGGVTAAVPVGRLGEYEAYLLTQEAAGSLPDRPGEVLASGPVITTKGS
jgi:Anti-sigma-K factor rskA